jgi:hypothetical protein
LRSAAAISGPTSAGEVFTSETVVILPVRKAGDASSSAVRSEAKQMGSNQGEGQVTNWKVLGNWLLLIVIHPKLDTADFNTCCKPAAPCTITVASSAPFTLSPTTRKPRD